MDTFLLAILTVFLVMICIIANNSFYIIGGDKMGKETLLKIGQIGCTALAGFLGICLTQLSIDKAVDKKVEALESADKKEDEA